jgi:hypothetical protein
MDEFGSDILVIMLGILVGIPILIGFRTAGRRRCWRCHVNMLPVGKRQRVFSLLPVGRCEGCNLPCLAMGPLRVKKKKRP